MPMLFAALALSAMLAGQATSPAPPAREPTDIFIRRQAGLPADSASGAISILDVGHHPMDTMLSIVGTRHGAVWHVSYACAESPHCAPGADHRAAEYDLSAADSAAVDAILADLRRGADPGGLKPTPTVIGGYLAVRIDDRGFRRTYDRVMAWGPVLGRLERLMADPAAMRATPP